VPLADVLDDASYDNDESATAGRVSVAAGTLTWTGDLAAGARAVVTFSVTIYVPYTGSGTLNLTVTSPTTGANCPAGSADPRCVVSTTVAALTITETASASSTVPGSNVSYTIVVSDAGQTGFTGATVTDDLTDVLDHATYGNDAAATSGTLSFTSSLLAWTGDLEPGGTVTITFAVTVDDFVTGNVALTSTVASTAAGSGCLPGIGNSLCAVSVGVTVGSLSVVAPAHAFLGTVSPGGIVENSLGTVEVTDGRGVGANWLVSVSSTNLITGSGSPAETIPAVAVGYDITGLSTTAGSTGVTHVRKASLSASPQLVVSATSASGESVVSWDPMIQVVVPPDAVAGVYTVTITYSAA
jgi:hypothetical protein